MLTVVTGWSPSGWTQYGQMFLRSFLRYWPKSVELVVYGEDFRRPRELDRCEHRVEFRDLLSIDHAAEVLAMYDSQTARGRTPAPGWKASALAGGYNWRFDAWKFCRQGIIPLAAAAHLEPGDLLCWLDGDVQTTRPVPEGFIETLLPAGYDLSYLGREPKHSEIGFQLYRIPKAAPMLAEFSALYTQGTILGAKEWHSAYAFDIARKISRIRSYNLTPGGSGHVWKGSVLQSYMTHNKGDRKIEAQRAFYAGMDPAT